MASEKFKANVVTKMSEKVDLADCHTTGRAIEAILSPELLHGECVSIGMIKEAEISRNFGFLSQVGISRLHKVLQDYGLPVSLDDNRKSIIAINMGTESQLSCILNQHLTSVTHSLLTPIPKLGQLSVTETHRALHFMGQLPKKKFYIFGYPIAHSMSPTIHNTGFEVLGLPHHYKIFESEDVIAAKPIIEDIEFGGASVTIPHKISIIPFLDQITEHSKLIGAVNTIIVDESDNGRRLIGDNTDWLGILNSIKPLVKIDSKTAGLVIGGGGTSRAALYALHNLGVTTIYLHNRTQAKIKDLINQFPTFGIIPLLSLSEPIPNPPQIIVSTIPATSNIEISDEIFSFGKGGVIVEMAYKPRKTQLLKKGDEKGWIGIEGIQVLIEQGLCQFEKWTGIRAPRNIIEENVYKNYVL